MIAFMDPEQVTVGIDNDELVRHMGLVRHVVNQHRNHPAMSRLGIDEADGIAQCALVEAARSYDPSERSESNFAGFACMVMRRRLRRALAKSGRRDGLEKLCPELPEQAEENAEPDHENREAIVAAWKQLDLADKILISEHFGMGLCESMPLSLDQLGEPYGITKSAMSRRVARAIAKLKRLAAR